MVIESPIFQRVGRGAVGVMAVLLCLLGGGCGNSDSGKEEPETGTPVGEESATASADGESLAGPCGDSEPGRDLAITDSDGEVIVLTVDENPPKGHPSDFFPTEPGTRWSYVITAGKVDPLGFGMTAWPMGIEGKGTVAMVATRRLLRSPAARTSYRLEVGVKGPAARQGPLQYPEGVELSIGRDDLGIFHECKQAFWAIGESGRYAVSLVLMFDPDSIGALGGGGGGFGSWGREDGYSVRPFLFFDKPGIAISLDDAPESLLFAGIDRKLPGYECLETLHFIRKVKPAEKEPGKEWNYLDEGFREDMWFARGQGLVRLVQKVKGETSMTMNLGSFHPGRE